NKILNTVRIELRTREARIEAVQAAISDNREKQRAEMGKRPEERINRTDILQMLEQMQVNEMIELTTARAKKDVVEQMTSQAKEFVELHRVLEGLPKPGGRNDRLNAELVNSEHGLERVEAKLANPTPEMLPPKVHEGKVTIYPVRVEK
ncbi:MAG: ATP synthase subunit B family protein, partial [Planctomycetota bacterium]